jgi:hypothetical protein
MCRRVLWWSGSQTSQHVVEDPRCTVVATEKAQRMISSLECHGRSEDPLGRSWRIRCEVIIVVWPVGRRRT